MSQLPVVFKKYFPDNTSGANVSLAYWYADPKRGSSEGNGIGLFVSLSGPGDFMGERVAKFMWDSFREEYFFSEGEPVDLLKRGVKAARDRLVVLMKNEESVVEQGVDVHLCAFSIVGGSAFFSTIGSPGVVLLRDDEIINIREMLPEYNGTGYRSEISVGSFELYKEDIFLISTPELVESFLDVFGEEKVKSAPASWKKICDELDLFSDNMAGNQFFWVVGYRIKDEISRKISKDSEKLVSDVEESSSTVDVVDAGLPKGLQQKGLQLKDRLKNLGKLFKWDNVKKWWAEDSRVQGMKRNIASKISSVKVGKKRNRKVFVSKGRVRGSSRKSEKILWIVVAIVVVAVIAVVILRIYNLRVYSAEIDANITLTSVDLDEASVEWNVNKDEAEAEVLLGSVFNSIESLRGKEMTDSQSETVDDLEKDALELSDRVRKVTPLTEDSGNIEILLDTYLKVGESADIRDICKRGEYLYFVDSASHTLYRYKIGSTTVDDVADSKDILKEPELVAIDDSYIFVYDRKLGIVSLEMDGDWKFNSMPELSIRSVGEIVEIGTFGGNLYMLDSKGGRVTKSFPAGVGFSYPVEYFQKDVLKGAVDLLIDGNIYVLVNAGDQIYKYHTGVPDQFKLSGFDRSLGSMCCGFTTHYGDKPMYVYDSDNSRIVAVEKGTSDKHPGVGVMVKQYEYRGKRDDIFEDVREIITDTDGMFLYVLDGTKILKVSLDHE